MENNEKISRRRFIGSVIGGAALVAVGSNLRPDEAAQDAALAPSKIPSRVFGKTGYDIPIFSLGGQATLEKEGTRDVSVEIINRAIDLGVRYIDTAAAYGKGISETYIGEVMKTRRKEVILASKTNDRTYDGSMRLLEKSLTNLQTDHLDTWQLHNVRTQEDLDKIFAPNGAIKALEKARDQKMTRFLGITGHYDPRILRKGIDQYPFDSILMALNAADKHNASFIEHLLPFAVEKRLAIIGMKIPARGRMFREGGITTMEQAMGYTLTLPVSTVIVGISTLKELEENVSLAKDFKPLTEEEMKKLEDLTKPYYADAAWFKLQW
jgi:hypothetical protein